MELTLYGVEIWATALLFARIGGMIMLLPGFGEPAVPPRVRLGLALAIAIALGPTLADRVPEAATNAFGMAAQVTSEALIGVLLGGAARILVSALATAGQIVGLEIGIAFAQTADPTQTQSGQLVAVFLSVMGVALIFVTGLHHMFLQGIVGSYDVISLGAPAPVGDAAELALQTTASSFRVGFQIAMPVVAAGLIFRVGLGVLSRLIPSIQVFFVALPLQIMGGLVVFALGLSTGMLIWLDSVQRYAMWLR
ncbi:MAG TPA: flagellar biosynthetic protein FliR [Vitreimonas sp.]|uniref:flagellar biosynthetic protein FliR n=1 Tax=Vitreimonas sp. TaxID=3069702 RepID=UPI002D26714D|nr:flagellar biosynthetic protein FliR [Vitreimonas sp.]HYD89099.1 flagellar biosynthetic protein FliR [Vitreimonas sp.]